MAEAIAHVLGTVGTGGVPVVAHALLRRLGGQWAPHLYYLTDRFADPPRRDRDVAALRAEGVQVRLVPAEVARDKSAVVATVARWIREDGVRVVHTHSTRPNRWGRLAALEVPGVRTVAHYHNHYDDKWFEGSEALAVEQELAPRTSALVACSDSVAAHLVDRLGVAPERVTVLPNGVEVDRFSGGDGAAVRAALGVPPGTRVVGVVGRLCAQKAPEDVLRAVCHLLGDDPRTELWFVGAPDDARLVLRLVHRAALLGVASRVRLLGFRSDMADVYAALDAVVLASRWEGFGLVVAEAMAAGRPVVATDVGGVGEAAGAAGPDGPAVRLVPPGDVEALRVGVAEVLDRPEVARDLAGRGARRAAAIGWDPAAARLGALYSRLLSGADVGVGVR